MSSWRAPSYILFIDGDILPVDEEVQDDVDVEREEGEGEAANGKIHSGLLVHNFPLILVCVSFLNTSQ